MKAIKHKYSIIEDKWEDGLPTYYVLKSTYLFGIHLIGQLYGIDGKDIPFQDLESAKEYLRCLK